MIYASELISSAHCGSPITGERKFKKAKSGVVSMSATVARSITRAITLVSV